MAKKEFQKSIKKREFEIMAFSDNFELPVRAKYGSIGYDLSAPEDIVIPAHSRCVVPLHFAINLPYGVEAKIEPRSGFSLRGMLGYGTRKVRSLLFGVIPWRKKVYGKWHFNADVIVGKIDPNYTGEVNVIVKNDDEAFVIKAGTRIAQMTFYNVGTPFFRLVEKLSCKSRGGGFSSSGTNRISTKPAKEEAAAAPAPHVSSETEVGELLQVDVL